MSTLIYGVTSLGRLFSSMLCSDPKLDSHRYKDILDEAIAAGKNITCFYWPQFQSEIFSDVGFTIVKE